MTKIAAIFMVVKLYQLFIEGNFERIASTVLIFTRFLIVTWLIWTYRKW